MMILRLKNGVLAVGLIAIFASSSISYSPSAVAKDGGSNGGGGGGINIQGRVYTMAEAGLRISETEEFYLDPDTIDATERLLGLFDSSLPKSLRGKYREYIFGVNRIYKKVTVVDPNLFERIKREYAQYTTSLNTTGTFVLAAYTSGYETLLFPDFFRALPSSRAIYLFHEAAFVLNPESRLENVLKFEIALFDLIKSPGDSRVRWNLQKSLSTLGFIEGRSLHALYIQHLENLGIRVTLDKIVDESVNKDILSLIHSFCVPTPIGDRGATQSFASSPTVVAKNANLDPDFKAMFLKVVVEGISHNVQFIRRRSPGQPEGHYTTGFGCHLANPKLENFQFSVGSLDSLSPYVTLVAIDKTVSDDLDPQNWGWFIPPSGPFLGTSVGIRPIGR